MVIHICGCVCVFCGWDVLWYIYRSMRLYLIHIYMFTSAVNLCNTLQRKRKTISMLNQFPSTFTYQPLLDNINIHTYVTHYSIYYSFICDWIVVRYVDQFMYMWMYLLVRRRCIVYDYYKLVFINITSKRHQICDLGHIYSI